jgi:hypothetical protein
MDFFCSTELAVPVPQIMVLLILTTTSLLFGRTRLALMVTYVFTLYWGYFFNRDVFYNYGQGVEHFLFIYFAFGFSVAIMAMVGFAFSHN